MNLKQHHNAKIKCSKCSNEIETLSSLLLCNSCLKKRLSARGTLTSKKQQYNRLGMDAFVKKNKNDLNLNQCISRVYDFSLEETKLGKFFIDLKEKGRIKWN